MPTAAGERSEMPADNGDDLVTRAGAGKGDDVRGMIAAGRERSVCAVAENLIMLLTQLEKPLREHLLDAAVAPAARQIGERFHGSIEHPRPRGEIDRAAVVGID